MTDVTVSSFTPTTSEASVVMDLVRSEWAKFRTVRSTYWSLIAAVIAMIGLGALISATQSGNHFSFDPVSISLSGVLLAQLAIGVLGVLFVTSEYSTGMIRTTFSAAPQRRIVIASKAAVFAVVALVLGTLTSLVTFLVGQAAMGHLGVSLTSPGAVRSVVGVGLYLGLLAVFAVGLGIATLFGLILVLPAIAQALPASIQNSIDKYLPSNAGQAIFHSIRDTSTLSPWVGLGVFALYAGATLVGGLIMVGRRDV
jgi:ABC-2 type transport system permease protein